MLERYPSPVPLAEGSLGAGGTYFGVLPPVIPDAAGVADAGAGAGAAGAGAGAAGAGEDAPMLERYPSPVPLAAGSLGAGGTYFGVLPPVIPDAAGVADAGAGAAAAGAGAGAGEDAPLATPPSLGGGGTYLGPPPPTIPGAAGVAATGAGAGAAGAGTGAAGAGAGEDAPMLERYPPVLGAGTLGGGGTYFCTPPPPIWSR